MTLPSLLLGAALPLSTAALFSYVGRLTRRRLVPAAVRPASLAFATWWYAAGAVMALNGGQTVLAILGNRDVSLYLLLVYAQALPLSLALAGLLIYLSYLYLGHFRTALPIAVFYTLFFAYTLYYFTSIGPWQIRVSGWDARLASAAGTATPAFLVFILLLTLPVFAGAVAYGSLYRKSPEPTQRFRIALVSFAFLLWFGTMAVGLLLVPADASWYPLVYQVPGLVASLFILAAYRPPLWLQHRYHVAAFAQA